jgi:hypothetical protein
MEANRRGPRSPGRTSSAGTRPAAAWPLCPEDRARLAIVERFFFEQDRQRCLQVSQVEQCPFADDDLAIADRIREKLARERTKLVRPRRPSG